MGEEKTIYYFAKNLSDEPIVGTATFNVTPAKAGQYFMKIDCFCFEEQILMPGERVQMPVTFFVDPEIVDDRDAKYTKVITLSYTFYEKDLPLEQENASLNRKINFNQLLSKGNPNGT